MAQNIVLANKSLDDIYLSNIESKINSKQDKLLFGATKSQSLDDSTFDLNLCTDYTTRYVWSYGEKPINFTNADNSGGGYTMYNISNRWGPMQIALPVILDENKPNGFIFIRTYFNNKWGNWYSITMQNEEPLLPTEYQPLEYLEVTGQQHIWTGIDHKTFNHFQTEVAWTSTSGEQHFFDCRTLSSNGYKMFLRLNNGYINYEYGDNSDLQLFQARANVWYPFESYMISGKQWAKINNITKNSNNETDTQGTPSMEMRLFCWQSIDQSKTAVDSPCYCKVKYILVANNNDLVAEYYPCRRKTDNKIGFYDIIRKRFDYSTDTTIGCLPGPNIILNSTNRAKFYTII